MNSFLTKSIMQLSFISVAVLVTILLASCSSVRSKGEQPQIGHPWFGSARLGDIATLEKILEEGSDINQASPMGTTALDVAALNGNVQVVKWLLEKGANAALLDRDNASALTYALTGHASGAKLTILSEMLIKAGSDPFVMTTTGFVPVEEMIERGMSDLVRQLNFSNDPKNPNKCDKMPINGWRGITLSRLARQTENISLAEFLESRGCW